MVLTDYGTRGQFDIVVVEGGVCPLVVRGPSEKTLSYFLLYRGYNVLRGCPVATVTPFILS